jgi:hypothetical protein
VSLSRLPITSLILTTRKATMLWWALLTWHVTQKFFFSYNICRTPYFMIRRVADEVSPPFLPPSPSSWQLSVCLWL